MNFLYKVLPLLAIMIASTFPICAEDADEILPTIPPISDLVRLHIENNYGKYDQNNLNSIYARGRILFFDMEETIERTFRIYKKRPNKYRSFYETKMGQKLVQLELIYNGVEAIQILFHEGKEVYREKLEGEALESVKFEAKIEGPFLLASEYPEFVTILGYDMIEGKKCILLSIDERSPYPYRNIWLDTTNYQEVKVNRYASNDLGEDVLEELYFRNYKTIQNVLFASRLDKEINGKRKFTTFIDNFEVNYGLFNSLFVVPSDSSIDSLVE